MTGGSHSAETKKDTKAGRNAVPCMCRVRGDWTIERSSTFPTVAVHSRRVEEAALDRSPAEVEERVHEDPGRDDRGPNIVH